MNKEKQFWDWFKKNEAKSFFLNQIDDDVEKESILNELEEHLHFYCKDLFFEVGGFPNQKQDIIISAQGVAEFFSKAEYLVNQAPELEHWNVIALKPPVEGAIIEYNDIKFNPEMMWFIPLVNEKSHQIGLRVYIDNYNSKDTDSFLNGTYLVIDNLLGEKSSGLDIGYVEIEKLPPIHEREDLIELQKLPRYVKWKKNQATA